MDGGGWVDVSELVYLYACLCSMGGVRLVHCLGRGVVLEVVKCLFRYLASSIC